MKKSEIKQAIVTLIQQKERFPKISELAEYLDLSENNARVCFQVLVEDGFLIRQGNWYRLAETPEEPSPAPLLSHTVSGKVESPKPEQKPAEEIHLEPRRKLKLPTFHKPEIKLRTPTVVIFIQISMGVIGGGAGIISMYYTSIWLLEFLPIFFAIILSSIMVGFCIMAFEVVILFLSGLYTHWTRWLIAVCFTVLWVAVSIFSVTSTVAGQYNEHVKSIRQISGQEQGNNPGRIAWKGIQEQKQEISQRMEEKREQIKGLSQLYSGMSNLDSRVKYKGTFADTDWKLKQAEKELDRLGKNQERLRLEEKELISQHPDMVNDKGEIKSIPDFYGWLAGVLKKDRDLIQFLLSLIPAVFVDIIAPVAIAIGIFLRKEKPVS